MFALKKQLASVPRGAQTIQAASRGFSAGPKIAAMDPKCTDFDIVFVGKLLFRCLYQHYARIHLQRREVALRVYVVQL